MQTIKKIYLNLKSLNTNIKIILLFITISLLLFIFLYISENNFTEITVIMGTNNTNNVKSNASFNYKINMESFLYYRKKPYFIKKFLNVNDLLQLKLTMSDKYPHLTFLLNYKLYIENYKIMIGKGFSLNYLIKYQYIALNNDLDILKLKHDIDTIRYLVLMGHTFMLLLLYIVILPYKPTGT